MSDISRLLDLYRQVRQTTLRLCEPLATEDYVIQCMADVSPPKWHLAHTTWFFEHFVLEPYSPDYQLVDERYGFLFNSYYRSVGEFHRRPERGCLSRPTVDKVIEFRHRVDDSMMNFLSKGDVPAAARELIRTGLHHEQQHQELLVMDIKYNFSRNPLVPPYFAGEVPEPRVSGHATEQWLSTEPQLVTTGTDEDSEFSFDNERPAHKNWLPGHSLRGTLITNREYLEFMEAGGYDDCLLWLSDGFDYLQRGRISGPEYWRRSDDGSYQEFQLTGLHPLDMEAPVQHVSYYEADAFARWAGYRLPFEAEWEQTCRQTPEESGHFLESGALLPRPQRGTYDLLGNLWEWTRTAYHAYPGYKMPKGSIGEYNAKFMAGTMVMRGGSYLSPKRHIRPTYRNFFAPHMRWQPGGIRLARDY